MSIEQALHCDVIGDGPALVLLHGWGVNSAIWQPIITPLSEHFTLYVVDLPGFGNSEAIETYSLQSICEAILKVVPESAVWCGWSLGGVIATYGAINYPQRVSKLIQVSSSVKFVANEQWSGVEASVFNNFLQGLEINPQKTLTRFIALQAMGCDSARQDSNTLKRLLADTVPAQQKALIAGLKLLAESDLRASFATISQPCLSLFGQFDSLVPLQATQDMKALLPHMELQLFEKSSHAPFISERDLFCKKVINFMFD